MQYRAYKLKALASPWTWQIGINIFTNKDTLALADGGAVASWELDDDYMTSNNSTINIVDKTSAVPGQIVALLEEEGTKAIGVISSVDNKKLQILFKPMLSIFDTDVLNPLRGSGSSASSITYSYDAVTQTAIFLAANYCRNDTDAYKRLPLVIRTSSSENAVWTYTENKINLRSLLIDLFDSHNITVTFNLVFTSEYAYIDVLIAQRSGGDKLIKDNVAGMEIEQVAESGAAATVCAVIDRESKALLSTWYLCADNTVTQNASAAGRVAPYKLAVQEFDSDNTDGATEEDAAREALQYNGFNHYIRLTLNKNTKLFPELVIGDSVLIVPEIDELTTNTTIEQNYEDRIFRSIYTGRKESSESSRVTLIFGKIRVNYTDIIQMRQMKKNRT